jgi:hypothetical protein
MLLMKVDVEAFRGVSTMYAMTVGNEEARVSKRMAPLADQTNASICPAEMLSEDSSAAHHDGTYEYPPRSFVWVCARALLDLELLASLEYP